MHRNGNGTAGRDYTDRLLRLGGARWKQILDVQAPYRWNLRRILGGRKVLDVGCGVGRHLAHLGPGSVGVDHNEDSVSACRARGLDARTPTELAESTDASHAFDGLLAAHVVEHLPAGSAAELLASYLPHLTDDARIVLICPQERGFRSDPTHVEFTDQAALGALCAEVGATVVSQSSFPLPRIAGEYFTHNEFVTVAEFGRSA